MDRTKRAHTHSDARNRPVPSAFDEDSEYKSVADLLKEASRISAELSASHRPAWMQTELGREPPAWQAHLRAATTVEDVILAIRHFGQSSVADRLYYLRSLPADEPHQKPVNLESVKGFAFFIMNNAYLPYPDITVNPDGYITIEWNVIGKGTLVLEFLPSEYVEYLDVLQQLEPTRQRQYNIGVSPIDDATDAAKLALHKLCLNEG